MTNQTCAALHCVVCGRLWISSTAGPGEKYTLCVDCEIRCRDCGQRIEPKPHLLWGYAQRGWLVCGYSCPGWGRWTREAIR